MTLIKDCIRFCYNKFRFRRKKISFPFSCKISVDSFVEGTNAFHENSRFAGSIGYGSYIGADSEIYGKIGRFCSIGSRVKIILGRHPYTYPYVSTSPMFFSLLKQTGSTFATEQRFEESKFAENKFPVVIGNDVWINSDVKIVSGVRIGDGAVLLAGSVITKDIPPYAIIGGVPARILKYRYSEEDIKFLENFKWWNQNIKWLKDNAAKFNNLIELKYTTT